MLERTRELFYTLNKIHNLVENKIYDINTREGFDVYEYDREGYDREGYDREGYDAQGYDRKGYDREGYDAQGYDRKEFDREGLNHQGLSREDIEEYVLQQKQGKGLKMITPKQMLSRLPALPAEIHAGNNSTKLKNEIRQLLYSL